MGNQQNTGNLINFELYQKKLYVFKTPGHAADLLSFGVMNYSRTTDLAGSLTHA